jgi:broad specificity phosphatase PhoE
MTREERFEIKDPGITDFGVLQCATLCATFPRMDKITHIVSSPSRRTILTTKYSFKPLLNRGVPILLLNFLKEKGHCPCNAGSGIAKLQEEFNDLNINYDRLEEGWENKNLDYGTHGWKPLAIEMRRELYLIGKEALEKGEVNADGNVEIVVTSHGGTLRTLDGSKNSPMRYSWTNTEHRPYEFFSEERAKKYGVMRWQGLRESFDKAFTTPGILKKLEVKDLQAWGWKDSEIDRINRYRDETLLGFQQMQKDRKELKS